MEANTSRSLFQSSVKREINISLALFSSFSLSLSLSRINEKKRGMREDSIRSSNGIYYARQAELMHSGADTMIASAGQCDFSLWTGRYPAFRFRCSMSTTSDGCVLTLFTASGRPVFDDRSRLMHYMIHAEFIRACTSIASVERVDDSRSSVIRRIENRESTFSNYSLRKQSRARKFLISIVIDIFNIHIEFYDGSTSVNF